MKNLVTYTAVLDNLMLGFAMQPETKKCTNEKQEKLRFPGLKVLNQRGRECRSPAASRCVAAVAGQKSSHFHELHK